MTLLDAIILALVEGVTEFLPVSSTGHLILTQHLLGIPASDFSKTFDIGIQLGAILSVVALYFRSFFDTALLKKLFVAFLPTAVIGFTLYPFIKSVLLESEWVVVWALALGGVALIAIELFCGKKGGGGEREVSAATLTYKQSFFVGLFQAIAVIPGVSRSGATIMGGLLLGIPRIAITEFSFLLAVPTMAAATGLDILKSASAFTPDTALIFLAGFVVSFFVALLSIRALLSFVRSHTFIPFGIYRILVALVFAFMVL